MLIECTLLLMICFLILVVVHLVKVMFDQYEKNVLTLLEDRQLLMNQLLPRTSILSDEQNYLALKEKIGEGMNGP